MQRRALYPVSTVLLTATVVETQETCAHGTIMVWRPVSISAPYGAPCAWQWGRWHRPRQGNRGAIYHTVLASAVGTSTENRQHAQNQWKNVSLNHDSLSCFSHYKTWWFWRSRQITLVRNAGPSQNPECPTEPFAQIVEKRDPA